MPLVLTQLPQQAMKENPPEVNTPTIFLHILNTSRPFGARLDYNLMLLCYPGQLSRLLYVDDCAIYELNKINE